MVEPWTYTQGVSPGAWISIYGTSLANTVQSWSAEPSQPLPTTLGGVTVSVNGLPAPVAYVSPTIVNVLVPAGVPQGQTTVVVNNQGIASGPYQIQSTQFLPAIYSNASTATSPPRYYVTAVDPITGQLVGNAALDPRVAHAARPGDTLDLYAIGLGPATPFTTDTAFSAAYPLTSMFNVVLGGAPISPVFAALVGPGLYQVRFTVPASMPAGDQSILLDFGSSRSSLSVYLTIAPQ